jgi:hypothetical protein
MAKPGNGPSDRNTASTAGIARLAAIAAVLLAATAALPAKAKQIGTATAVNPLSETTAPGGSTVTLKVGAPVVHKQRIHTTPSGSVQLLFLDKSTLSIAPNTNILIDEFVYDRDSNSGHMLAKLTEGALRYVGGNLSHAGEAEIATPAAAIGIRGGTVMVLIDKTGTHIINLFGLINIHNGAGDIVISRPGFEIVLFNWNTPPGDPTRVTQAEIDYLQQILTSQPGQNGGVPGLQTVTVGECAILGLPPGNNCANLPWIPTDQGESQAFQLILQGAQFGSTQGPPPLPPQETDTNLIRNNVR